MQPTFTVELPATTNNLQFIDVNDPAKSTIVRRKAREWVNKNKDATNRTRQKKLRSASEDVTGKGREKEWSGEVIQLPRKHSRDAIVIPLNGGLRQFDPFNIFPDVGRKYDHIVEFCRFTPSPSKDP
ncbi:hypothetical protein CC86DRAFT_365161 [Ophiobolus disseminans]|uniref:Uncharacterized protein n=1 Tax=Ophiobolus disseminans TaxID=1469910 RepID=A0A6A7AJ08_9PLEO|nr:hypothetical protein CC86DRAFT_365161 [Ophiobolus disseminans]